MTALYIGSAIIVVALAGYLIVALIKPELFP